MGQSAGLKIISDKSIVIFLFSCCSLYSAAWPQTSEQSSSLTMQGKTYPSVCTIKENMTLRRSLLLQNYPDKNQAWKLVETVLCAPNNDATRPTLTITRHAGSGRQVLMGFLHQYQAGMKK